MKFYLAYGSNLSVEQMLYRCPDAMYVGVAVIPDYRLLFRGSKTGSYLTIEPMKGRMVPVVVWKVSDEDERSLDYYEGCPRFYRKEVMNVTLHSLVDGTSMGTVDAFVYIMDESRPLGMPTEDYYRVCADGYRRFGFDESNLKRAAQESAWRRQRSGGGRR